MERDSSDHHLCYLAASKVVTPVGELADVDLRGPDDAKVGTVGGVLIDPECRCVRYFVVEAPGWFRNRHYLLAADAAIRLERDRRTLKLDDDTEFSTEFDIRSARPMSDEDLLAALFASQAA